MGPKCKPRFCSDQSIKAATYHRITNLRLWVNLIAEMLFWWGDKPMIKFIAFTMYVWPISVSHFQHLAPRLLVRGSKENVFPFESWWNIGQGKWRSDQSRPLENSMFYLPCNARSSTRSERSSDTTISAAINLMRSSDELKPYKGLT